MEETSANSVTIAGWDGSNRRPRTPTWSAKDDLTTIALTPVGLVRGVLGGDLGEPATIAGGRLEGAATDANVVREKGFCGADSFAPYGLLQDILGGDLSGIRGDRHLGRLEESPPTPPWLESEHGQRG